MERLFKGYRIVVMKNDFSDSMYVVHYYKVNSGESLEDQMYIDNESRDIMQAMHKAKVKLRKILKELPF